MSRRENNNPLTIERKHCWPQKQFFFLRLPIKIFEFHIPYYYVHGVVTTLHLELCDEQEVFFYCFYYWTDTQMAQSQSIFENLFTCFQKFFFSFFLFHIVFSFSVVVRLLFFIYIFIIFTNVDTMSACIVWMYNL